MAKTPKTYRLSEETLTRLDDLARKWGGEAGPADITRTLELTIQRQHTVEFHAAGPEPSPKKSGGRKKS